MKKFLTRVSNAVGEDLARAGISQLDATHVPFWLDALMSKTLAMEVAALATLAALAATLGTGGWGGVATFCTGGGTVAFCIGGGGGVGGVTILGAGGGVVTPIGTLFPQLVQNLLPGTNSLPHAVQNLIIDILVFVVHLSNCLDDITHGLCESFKRVAMTCKGFLHFHHVLLTIDEWLYSLDGITKFLRNHGASIHVETVHVA